MQKIIKIGTNRKKARLWLEGQCLLAMGWEKGDYFIAEFKKGEVIYRRPADWRETELADKQRQLRTVSGTKARPVIDTNTDKILNSIGDFKYVEVSINKDRIEIVGTETKPNSIINRITKGAVMLAAMIAPLVTQFKPHSQKILVACEESGRVRNELTKLGHDAISCDLMPTSDPSGWHIQDDVLKYLDYNWDKVIAFTPCTFFTNSAAWAFKDGPQTVVSVNSSRGSMTLHAWKKSESHDARAKLFADSFRHITGIGLLKSNKTSNREEDA